MPYVLCLLLGLGLASCMGDGATTTPGDPIEGKWIEAADFDKPIENYYSRILEISGDSLRFYTWWGDCFYKDIGYSRPLDSASRRLIRKIGDTLCMFDEFSSAIYSKRVIFEKPSCFTQEPIAYLEDSIYLNEGQDTIHVEFEYRINPLPADSMKYYAVINFNVIEFPGCEKYVAELTDVEGGLHSRIPIASARCKPGNNWFSVSVDIGFKHPHGDTTLVLPLASQGKAFP